MPGDIIKDRAALYDLEYPPNFYGDLDYICRFAHKTCENDGRILDLGAGTGRVGIHLLKNGFKNVTMVDNDSSMIDVIKRKLINHLGVNKDNGIEIINDSMEMPIESKRFNLVIITGNTFTSLLNKAEQLRVFENIKNCLADKGLAIIHIYTPCVGRDSFDYYGFTYKFRIPNSSYIYHRYVRNEFSPDNQYVIFNFMYKIYDADMYIGEFSNSVTTRIVSHSEMKWLVETCHLKIIAINKGFSDLHTQKNDGSCVYVIGKT